MSIISATPMITIYVHYNLKFYIFYHHHHHHHHHHQPTRLRTAPAPAAPASGIVASWQPKQRQRPRCQVSPHLPQAVMERQMDVVNSGKMDSAWNRLKWLLEWLESSKMSFNIYVGLLLGRKWNRISSGISNFKRNIAQYCIETPKVWVASIILLIRICKWSIDGLISCVNAGEVVLFTIQGSN